MTKSRCLRRLPTAYSIPCQSTLSCRSGSTLRSTLENPTTVSLSASLDKAQQEQLVTMVRELVEQVVHQSAQDGQAPEAGETTG